jgi:hypothetical protein
MGQKMACLGHRGTARSRQDESKEVGELGSKRTSSRGKEGHHVWWSGLIFRLLPGVAAVGGLHVLSLAPIAHQRVAAFGGALVIYVHRGRRGLWLWLGLLLSRTRFLALAFCSFISLPCCNHATRNNFYSNRLIHFLHDPLFVSTTRAT